MRIGHGIGHCATFGNPLLGSGWALDEFPVVFQKDLEVVVVPLGGVGCPRTFDAAGDGVNSVALCLGVDPTETLRRNWCTLGGWPDVLAGVASAVGFAEGVSTGGQRHSFFVVHRHAGKGFANVASRSQWVCFAVGAFWVDIDQAHLHSGKRIVELTITLVALIGQPGGLCAPVGLVWFIDVWTSATETECLEAHGFHSDVAGQDHEVGP